MKHVYPQKRDAAGRRRGFTLYYAVVYSSLLLLVGASILNRTLKEFQLTSSIQESQRAFFAADTGIDCAIYWDTRYLSPANQLAMFPPLGFQGNLPDIRCQGNTNPGAQVRESGTLYSGPVAIGSYAVTDFKFDVDGKYCSQVAVRKDYYNGVINGVYTQKVVTTVKATGNNLTCAASSPRKLERGLVMQY